MEFRGLDAFRIGPVWKHSLRLLSQILLTALDLARDLEWLLSTGDCENDKEKRLLATLGFRGDTAYFFLVESQVMASVSTRTVYATG